MRNTTHKNDKKMTRARTHTHTNQYVNMKMKSVVESRATYTQKVTVNRPDVVV